MDELKAYSVKLRKMVAIKDPELVTLKNGRKAVRGVASEDPSSKVIIFVSDERAEEIQGDAWLIGPPRLDRGGIETLALEF